MRERKKERKSVSVLHWYQQKELTVNDVVNHKLALRWQLDNITTTIAANMEFNILCLCIEYFSARRSLLFYQTS